MFENEFEITGTRKDIPTIKEILFFIEILLVLRSDKVKRQTIFQGDKYPILTTPVSTNQFIGLFPFALGTLPRVS